MKKILFLFVLLGQFAFAQQIKQGSVQLLEGTEKGGFFHPVFSPQGNFLLTTAENYAGLNKHVLGTNRVERLTSDLGAGYAVRISKDENTILYRKTEFVNNLRHSSLQQFSIPARATVELERATREILVPQFAENAPMYVRGEKLVRSNNMSETPAAFINIEDQKMVLYVGNTRKVLTPNGEDASYFWASVSPDQKHIVYTTAHGGTFVSTIDGKNPVSLGRLGAPKWINNEWVIGMDDKDDGYNVTSSVIVASTIDGKVRQVLATPQIPIAMYPSASPDGARIAFNTGEGQIYLMNIEISK